LKGIPIFHREGMKAGTRIKIQKDDLLLKKRNKLRYVYTNNVIVR
jgi:hypothetical protein